MKGHSLHSAVTKQGFNALLINHSIGKTILGLCVACGLLSNAAPVRANGYVFYASGNGQIMKLDTTTGNATTFAFVQSLFAAFDPQGDLYTGSWGSDDSVSKIDPNGNVSVLSAATGLWINGGGAAVDSSGNLFLVRYSSNANERQIVKYDVNGNRSVFASISNDWFAGLAFDSSENLYASLNGGSILKYDQNGSVSTFASGLGEPAGLAFDTSGNLYAADRNGWYTPGTIVKIDKNGHESTFANVGDMPGIVFDNSGNLLVLSMGPWTGNQNGPGTLERIDPSGNQVMIATGLIYPNPGDGTIAYQSTGSVPGESVPEPGICSMLALGIGLVFGRQWRKEHS